MLDVSLTYPTPEGSREIRLESDKTTFGRGSEAEHRFADDGLSRLHASIYKDGDRVWIVDENSSNGTYVNGAAVRSTGTPLKEGDSIKIGHNTVLRVRIEHQLSAVKPQPTLSFEPQQTATSVSPGQINILPIALIALGFFVVSVSAVFIGFKVLGSNKTEVVRTDDIKTIDTEPTKDPKSSPTPKKETGNSTTTSSDNSVLTNSPESTPTTTNLPPGKKYLDMSDSERRQYLGARAMKIAQIIGNSSSEQIPEAAIDKIKSFTDAYAKRVSVKPLGGCKFGDNLQVTFERASKNAPFIVKAFNEKGTDPRIGLYLAMIESEHCVCLQSPTGPLGMFQFTKATGELHGLKTVKGASPTNPDERCEPEPAARAAASYMKALTGRYGTGPASVPLAIGSYNSGEGGLSSNLVKALDSNSGLPRDFWTLISKGEMLSKQFQSENFKYVPKFFAAAIIGENPQDFGLNLQPLSTYSK